MKSFVDNFRLKLIVYQKPGLFFKESKVLGVPTQEKFTIIYIYIYIYADICIDIYIYIYIYMCCWFEDGLVGFLV